MNFSLNGWEEYSIWDHSTQICELYEKRCRKLVEEMIAHKQAAFLLRPLVEAGDSLLDVGCGSGYFFHSLQKYQVPVDYYGIDASLRLLDIGKRIMPEYNLATEKLLHGRIEDLEGKVDHVVCINVLSNLDNYHRPLERFLKIAQKTLILRESLAATAHYSYVKDRFLDEGVDLSVYVNTYDYNEVLNFIHAYGFKAELVVDEYTGGNPQKVIGYDHYWSFVLAERLK